MKLDNLIICQTIMLSLTWCLKPFPNGLFFFRFSLHINTISRKIAIVLTANMAHIKNSNFLNVESQQFYFKSPTQCIWSAPVPLRKGTGVERKAQCVRVEGQALNWERGTCALAYLHVFSVVSLVKPFLSLDFI